MTSSRAVTRRAALAAFLLFAAALLVVGPAEASRTTTDARSHLAASSLELSPLDLVEPAAPVESSSRLGFGEDLGPLDPERGPGDFVAFARETSRCELTYARNNPLKYVDPDGRAIKPVNFVWQQILSEAARDTRQGIETGLKIVEGMGRLTGFGDETKLAVTPLRDLAAVLFPKSVNEMLLGATGLALLIPTDGAGRLAAEAGALKGAGELTDGMRMATNDALAAADSFLGKGAKDMGKGRFLSADGLRQVRLGDRDILGLHGGGPHLNFETLAPNPAKPGKMEIVKDLHVYLTD